jgi:hypothetical protein
MFSVKVVATGSRGRLDSPTSSYSRTTTRAIGLLYANMGSGFVVNALRGTSPGEPILHRAACDTITPTPDKTWTGEYIKVCSTDRFELESWARGLDRRLTACEFCDP